MSADEGPYFPSLPVWAEWLAQDADGSWWAYEVCPNQYDSGWHENELGRRQRLVTTEHSQHWQESLRRTKQDPVI